MGNASDTFIERATSESQGWGVNFGRNFGNVRMIVRNASELANAFNPSFPLFPIPTRYIERKDWVHMAEKLPRHT